MLVGGVVQVELEFSADFMFSIGSLYRAPPLVVDTLLTTEVAKGHMRQGEGGYKVRFTWQLQTCWRSSYCSCQ